MSMFKQLSLPVGLDNQATFANFYAPNGTPHHMAPFLLRDESRMFAYICGPQGSGLSHLSFRLHVRSIRLAVEEAIFTCP